MTQLFNNSTESSDLLSPTNFKLINLNEIPNSTKEKSSNSNFIRKKRKNYNRPKTETNPKLIIDDANNNPNFQTNSMKCNNELGIQIHPQEIQIISEPQISDSVDEISTPTRNQGENSSQKRRSRWAEFRKKRKEKKESKETNVSINESNETNVTNSLTMESQVSINNSSDNSSLNQQENTITKSHKKQSNRKRKPHKKLASSKQEIENSQQTTLSKESMDQSNIINNEVTLSDSNQSSETKNYSESNNTMTSNLHLKKNAKFGNQKKVEQIVPIQINISNKRKLDNYHTSPNKRQNIDNTNQSNHGINSNNGNRVNSQPNLNFFDRPKRFGNQFNSNRVFRVLSNSSMQDKFPCFDFNKKKCKNKFGIDSGRNGSCKHIHCYYHEICKHFFSERGCMNGDNCPYVHCSLKAKHIQQFWDYKYGTNNGAKHYLELNGEPKHHHVDKLLFWDFDNTLFNTYTREEAIDLWQKLNPKQPWPEEIGNSWWGNKLSLEAPFDCIDKGPAYSDCIEEIQANRSNVLKAMITGRLFSLKPQVLKVLYDNQIPEGAISHLIFKPDKWPLGTITYKVAVILNLMKQYKNTKEIEIWEDRPEHVIEFGYYLNRELKKYNVNLSIHFVAPVPKYIYNFQKESLYSDCIVLTSS